MKLRRVSGRSLRRSALTRTTKSNKAPYQTQSFASRILVAPTAAAMSGVARDLLATRAEQVWLLSGSLGSGKTTLTRAVLRRLGYRGVVASPTFVLARHYHIHHGNWRRVVHVDAYRLRSRGEEAAIDIGSALEDPRCLLLVEWPELLRARYRWQPLRLRLVRFGKGRKIIIRKQG